MSIFSGVFSKKYLKQKKLNERRDAAKQSVMRWHEKNSNKST